MILGEVSSGGDRGPDFIICCGLKICFTIYRFQFHLVCFKSNLGGQTAEYGTCARVHSMFNHASDFMIHNR